MRNNFKELIKEELVKRFETVVQEEIKGHNIAIEKTNRDISEMKNLFEDHKRQLIEMKKYHDKVLDDCKNKYEKDIEKIKEKYSFQDKYLKDKGNDLEKFKKQTCLTLDSLVKKKDFDDFFFRNTTTTQNLSKCILEEKKEREKNIHQSQKKNEEKFEYEKGLLKKEFADLKNEVKSLRNALEINIVDAKGISRMIKAEQKSTFIIEKKIENLYKLIERLNQRIDA